ncbi:MAG: CBS domain-containing protein, partial [Microcystaceae cyanobacterium]
MAIKVKDLMDSRQELALVTAKFDGLVTDALSDMLENNFSQLPVIDNDGKLFGIISTNSILKAIQVFNVPFNELRVYHAAEK